jgi:lipopolysaccharide/colanic/teichoic acid biosynthesis glycosyltransferase
LHTTYERPDVGITPVSMLLSDGMAHAGYFLVRMENSERTTEQQMDQDHNITESTPVPVVLGYGRVDSFSGERSRPRTVDSPATCFSYRVMKRASDVALVLMCAPIWVTLSLLLALCVMLTSPGPIFFSHRRIGRSGKFFSMWKFRTMCVNSAEVLEQHLAKNRDIRAEWAENHKLKSDPRVTPLGRFLRRSSLDELPQLWNVLTGRMSLVGPRPIVAAEAEKYGRDFAYYLAVKPGIAGLWQASGRSTLSYEERVSLDRRYVEEWSFWGDYRILIRTLTKVANTHGAY